MILLLTFFLYYVKKICTFVELFYQNAILHFPISSHNENKNLMIKIF